MNKHIFQISKRKHIPAHDIELIAECRIWKSKDTVCLHLTTESSSEITADDIALLKEAVNQLKVR